MIRLSVMYPNGSASTFDWDYYLGPHPALAKKFLAQRGLLRIEIDRGVGAFPPGAPVLFHTLGHLFFHRMQDLESAMAATASEFIEDQPKYLSGESIIQISGVVET